jgi:hypothetical protein
MNIELINCECGDWQVLKVNSNIYHEGHAIHGCIWLKLIKEILQTHSTSEYKVSTITISDQDMEERNFM